MDSVCKGLEKDKCLPPKCKYASGKKLSYCRKNTTKINNARPVSPKPVTHVLSECKGLEKDKCLPPKWIIFLKLFLLFGGGEIT